MNILNRLKLRVLEKGNDYIIFRVSHQNENLRHTGGVFSIGIMNILTTPDIEIKSSNEPEVREDDRKLFLRGSNHEKDYKKLKCSKEFYNKIQTGISMINNNKKFLY